MTLTGSASIDELAHRIVAGEPSAIARGITWCEEGGPRAEALLGVLPSSRGHVIGLTGTPGAGKSTLLNVLVRAYRKAGVKVGVVAVDPTSPISGGALLGDRIRLEGVSGDRGVFFRSLASRGALGGLSNATRAAASLLSAGGFGVVLIETVGAGQAEVQVMRVADTVVVVLIPGAGDEIQALKAGIMEIADVYVLNKADQPGIRDLRRNVLSLLQLREGSGWKPPVVEAVAREGKGIDELLAALHRHEMYLQDGTGAARAMAGARAEALRLARAAFDEAMEAERAGVLEQLDVGRIGEIEAGRELARRAAARLVEA